MTSSRTDKRLRDAQPSPSCPACAADITRQRDILQFKRVYLRCVFHRDLFDAAMVHETSKESA